MFAMQLHRRLLLAASLGCALLIAGAPEPAFANRAGRANRTAASLARGAKAGRAARGAKAARTGKGRGAIRRLIGRSRTGKPVDAKAAFQRRVTRRDVRRGARGDVRRSAKRAVRPGTRQKIRPGARGVEARRGGRARAIGRRVASAARTAGRGAAALARGIAIDGPRHTWRAVKRNPLMFAAGAFLIGSIGAAGRFFGFNGEIAAFGLSSMAVLVQVKASLPAVKAARGVDKLRAIGSEIVWPALFFAGSTAFGHSLGQHAASGGHGAPGASDLGTAFVSSAIIGGDAPAIGVTALDSVRGGAGEAEAGAH